MREDLGGRATGPIDALGIVKGLAGCPLHRIRVESERVGGEPEYVWELIGYPLAKPAICYLLPSVLYT